MLDTRFALSDVSNETQYVWTWSRCAGGRYAVVLRPVYSDTTPLDVELSCVAIDISPTQLDVELS